MGRNFGKPINSISPLTGLHVDEIETAKRIRYAVLSLPDYPFVVPDLFYKDQCFCFAGMGREDCVAFAGMIQRHSKHGDLNQDERAALQSIYIKIGPVMRAIIEGPTTNSESAG